MNRYREPKELDPSRYIKYQGEEGYLKIIRDIIDLGYYHSVRNGFVNTLIAVSWFSSVKNGRIPLLTVKKLPLNIILAELLWFLRGPRDDGSMSNDEFRKILGGKYLETVIHNGKECYVHPTIWTLDGYRHNTGENYDMENRASIPVGSDDNLGPVYGSQWRYYNKSVDQIHNVISNIKKDKYSRYHFFSGWNPSEIKNMALPPCHLSSYISIDESDHMTWTMYQRSCDFFLGVPFNIASYGFLLHMVAMATGYKPGNLIIIFQDAHVYEHHIPATKELLKRSPSAKQPRLNQKKMEKAMEKISPLFTQKYSDEDKRVKIDDIRDAIDIIVDSIEDYDPQPTIRAVQS